MRQWRVGSFSMGLVLVLLGIGLLLYQFKGSPAALDLIINWWPLALIFLGIEVLVAGFFQRGDKISIKYDFWSVLLVIVFFFSSLAGYALHESGMITLVREAVQVKEHAVTLPEEVIPLTGIERVVLSCAGGELELRSSDGDAARIFGQGTFIAASAGEAAALAKTINAEYYVEGSTLYLQINQHSPRSRTPFGWHRTGEVSRTVLVPAGVALELRRSSGYQTRVILNDLAAPWSIHADGTLQAELSSSLDATVYGLSSHAGSFRGNADWSVGETDSQAVATFTLGEGAWPLNLTADWEIEVNVH